MDQFLSFRPSRAEISPLSPFFCGFIALRLAVFCPTKIIEKRRIRFGNQQESKKGFRLGCAKQRMAKAFDAKLFESKRVSDEVKRVFDTKRTHAKGRH